MGSNEPTVLPILPAATAVVSVRVADLRALGYSGFKDWAKDPKNVYIGRPMNRMGITGSKWGNPFPLTRYAWDESMTKYEQYLYDSGLIKQIGELCGKNLGCWCAPNKCHGDLLMQLANEVESKPRADNIN